MVRRALSSCAPNTIYHLVTVLKVSLSHCIQCHYIPSGTLFKVPLSYLLSVFRASVLNLVTLFPMFCLVTVSRVSLSHLLAACIQKSLYSFW